jgi:hypothetical protein
MSLVQAAKAAFDYQLGKFTGTCANAVMTYTPAALNEFYLIKIGEKVPEPPNWAMLAGSHMESLILDWVESVTDEISRRGDVVDHPLVSDICVKLDGYRAADDAILECKFLAPWRNREEFFPSYYAQVCLQMICTGARNGRLVVAQGTTEPVEYEMEFDQDYADELMRRAEAFLHCLRTLTPPYPLPPVIPREKWRTIDVLREPTNWSADLFNHLEQHDETAEAAKAHEDAGKAARALIPDDVGKVFAGPWQITRNRKGVLAITRRAT